MILIRTIKDTQKATIHAQFAYVINGDSEKKNADKKSVTKYESLCLAFQNEKQKGLQWVNWASDSYPVKYRNMFLIFQSYQCILMKHI